jgi:membrane-bound metal-dependent hydrolase YbcI (DUF457 family)
MMSSILGHGLMGISVASAVAAKSETKNRRKLFVLAAILSLIPDTDVLFYIAFGVLGMTPHRGITHTLSFAVLMGLALTALFRSYFDLTFQRSFLLFFGVLFTHLVLDYLMGCGPAVPFFWPLTDQGYLFPYKVVPTAYYALSVAGLASVLLHPATLIGMLIETVIFLPLFLISQRRSTSSRLMLTAISIIGLLCSIVLYNRIP